MGCMKSCKLTVSHHIFSWFEGYMDVVALAQYNVDYSVASLGTSTTGDHLQVLFRQLTPSCVVMMVIEPVETRPGERLRMPYHT